jgi:1-acyl-sn-glycerol-3-phosphate acyltransferase
VSETAATEPAASDRPGWLNTATFWVFWAVVGGFLRLWFRLRIENRPRLQGAFVLAPNHASFLDPLLVGGALRRRVVFMMTEVIWRSPRLHWFYRWSHAIPVAERSSNREALRAAREVLRQGRVIGIFPEGGLSRDGGLLLGNPGAVSLVLNAAVPIVPVGVIGADRALAPGKWFPRPRRIVIRFGDPILPAELVALAPEDRKARLVAATRLIMERIAALTGTESREAELGRLRRGAPAG